MKTGKIVGLTIMVPIVVLLAYYFFPEQKLDPGTKIDEIVVYKSKRDLMVYSQGRLVKTYKISLGRYPVGDKQYEGDKKTPEGIYFINGKNPKSAYYKNLGISYPDKQDIKTSRNLGKPTGGDVKIHGLRNGLGFVGKFQRWFDWTAGCIALTNEEVEELYRAVDIGTRIEINP